MSASKRLSLVRQFSLQCETSKPQQRKQSLKKQASEELIDAKSEVGMRISLSAKTRAKIVDRPPPARIAWTEKPSPQKTSGAEKESILNVTDKLRQAWKEKEQSKQNLDIFLTPNDDDDDRCNNDAPETPRSARGEKLGEPKIILPLKPEISNENVKNVFQKRIRKAMKQKSIFADSSCYSPPTNRSNENKCSTIVVPVVDRKSITPPPAPPAKRILSRQNTMEKEQDKAEEILAKQVVSNVIIRPSTAASKREMFQKRTNSAFHGSTKKDGGNNFRPPLIRASSVPSRPEQKQPKFLSANKRVRAKTAKAKLKSDASEDDSDLSGGDRGRRTQRCVSVNGEVETMISLISPSGSDNEGDESEEKTNAEDEDENKEKAKSKLDEKLEGYREQQKNFSLRKTVKSVSFQQSSIHAVRSFSASFPARRCSVATALMLSGNKTASGKTDGGGQKIQEKRAPVNVLEDEQSVPKRRLVRTKSAPLRQQSIDDKGETPPAEENKSDPNKGEPSVSTRSKTAPDNEENPSDEKKKADETSEKAEEGASGSSEPQFENPKEKQCWELYRKMNAKGVSISFDTILRGMLTPTEYRLRRKPSVVPEDNYEITTGN